MQANRGRDTAPELAVRRELHRRGLRFFVNRRPVPEIRRTADLLFPRLKVAVLIDGCFWHGCSQHHTVAKTHADFWANKITLNMKRDAETNKLWAERGWLVLRYWEHDDARTIADAVQREIALLDQA